MTDVITIYSRRKVAPQLDVANQVSLLFYNKRFSTTDTSILGKAQCIHTKNIGGKSVHIKIPSGCELIEGRGIPDIIKNMIRHAKTKGVKCTYEEG